MMRLLRVFLRWWRTESKTEAGISSSVAKEIFVGLSKSANAPKPSALVRKSTARLRVQVGFDFGTSNSKVAYKPSGTAAVIPMLFEHQLPYCPQYCYPSLLSIRNEQIITGIEAAQSLVHSSWNSGIRRIKVAVAGKYTAQFKDNQITEQIQNYVDWNIGDKNRLLEHHLEEQLACIYLAHTIKVIKNNICEFLKKKEHEIEFVFNIGIPIDQYEKSSLREGYEKIFAWSGLLEQKWPNNDTSFDSLQCAKDLFYNAKYDIESDETRIFAVPEAVAEVAPYLSSIKAQDGIHAIIDFGAGTTDISIFNYMRCLQDQSFWYAASNIPIGMGDVELAVATFLNSEKGDDNLQFSEIAKVIGQLIDNDYKTEALSDSIRTVFERIYHETVNVWGRAYNHQRGTDNWKKSRILVSGGGAHNPDVRRIFSVPWYYNIADCSFSVELLSGPDNSQWTKSTPFHRMAVAVGLTKALPELKKFQLPNDCPDQTSPPLPVINTDDLWDGRAINPRGWV